MKQESAKDLERYGVKVTEHSLGAFTGEFPTIIVVALSGIAGGLLGAIGTDIWEAIKKYVRHRVKSLHKDRERKKGKGEGRHNVINVYLIGDAIGFPIVYYSLPQGGIVMEDIDIDALRKTESDIVILAKAKKVQADSFYGINLATVGHGPHLRLMKAIPNSDDAIISEMTTDLEEIQGLSHVYAAFDLQNIGELERAQEHYEIATQVIKDETRVWVSLGIVYARRGDTSSAIRAWETAASIDGRLDILHYNIACMHAEQGRVEDAAQELHHAMSKGWDELDDLLSDICFSDVIDTPEIQKVIEELRDKSS
jgi:tetratricopeptide (TPR) repeat protein